MTGGSAGSTDGVATVGEQGTQRRGEASSIAARLVLIAGATSTAGHVAARILASEGARVVAVGHDDHKLAALAVAVPGIGTELCDLTDEAAVAGLAERVHTEHGAVDGILHLVGGWRGGGGLAGQTDDDFRFLEGSLTALRHVSRAFDADLRSSTAGRLAIVSSTAVTRPLAGGANYAAVKAASEAWARAVGQGFAKAARDAGVPLAAASVIFRVKSLDGVEERLARAFADLWPAHPASVNDQVIDLSRS